MIRRFCYLILFPAVLWAQYNGGVADGAAANSSNEFVSLNGPILLTFFNGGPADGHSQISTNSYIGLNGPISQIFFLGGNGDGFGITQTSSYYGMNGPISTISFKGGNGDGFTQVATADPYGLNGAIPTYIFKGGNGDGHGSKTSSDYLALNGPLPTFTYRGGNGDGFGYVGTSGDVSLPVMFASMSAVAGDRQVELIWITEAEIENAGFIIRRRDALDTNYRDIASFQTHPELKGAGTSNERRTYRFVDRFVLNGVEYQYLIVEVDFNGRQIEHGPVSAIPMPAGLTLKRTRGNVPRQLALLPNYPNPFNPETWISFGIPATRNELTPASVILYDMLGRPVRVLVNDILAPGYYKILWDGRNDAGEPVPSGVYVCRLSWNGHTLSRKLTLAK